MAIFASFLHHVFPASRVQLISDLHSDFACTKATLGVVDIQSTTAEIRRGRKEERRRKKSKKPQDENI